MYILLLPLILFLAPASAGSVTPELCEEIREVLLEQMEWGYINEQEADSIYGSCAGHRDLNQEAA